MKKTVGMITSFICSAVFLWGASVSMAESALGNIVVPGVSHGKITVGGAPPPSPASGDKQGDSTLYNDDGESDTEVFMIPMRDGDKDLIQEWLKTFLDADEYFEAVHGEYYMLPFSVVGDAPDRLRGYPVSGGETK